MPIRTFWDSTNSAYFDENILITDSIEFDAFIQG